MDFCRNRNLNESYFKKDYEKLLKCNTLTKIRKYKFNSTNEFAIKVINQLKEDLENKLKALNIQKKKRT